MSKDYTTNVSNKNYNLCKQKFNIWIVNNRGEVFIKDLFKHAAQIYINDLTFEGNSSEDLIEQLELIWQLNIKIQAFKQFYYFLSQNQKVHIVGYMLQVNTTQAEEKLIEKLMHGRFVDYMDIDESIKVPRKNMDCVEAYITVIDELDKIYGIPVVDLM